MEIDYTKNLPVKKIKKRSPAGRFFAKIKVSEVLFHEGTACWEWQNSNSGGYGRFRLNEVESYAHRSAYLLFVGTIPEDKEIDHRCRRRHCVNPLHLEAVPHKVNQERMAEVKTECVNGHAFTPENTFKLKSGRGCKACRYQRIKEWRERNPDKAREMNTASKKAWRKAQADSGRAGRF